MNFIVTVLFYLLTIGPPSPINQVEVIKFEDLDRVTAKSDSNIKLINFWASWCGPCVKEMPYLEQLNQSGKAEVVFISLDFIKDFDKVKDLVSKKGIQSKVYLLNETNYDKLITKIDPNWGGAIPATILIDSKGQKHFYEKSFSQSELSDLIAFYTPK